MVHIKCAMTYYVTIEIMVGVKPLLKYVYAIDFSWRNKLQHIFFAAVHFNAALLEYMDVRYLYYKSP